MTDVNASELAERDPGMCVCRGTTSPPTESGAPAGAASARGSATLAVLADVRRLYEERMAQLDSLSGTAKLKTQVEVLRCWVNDLVGQNTLLIRAVEELEAEATSKLLLERRRHSEVVCELREEKCKLERRLALKDVDLRGMVEVLRRLREFDLLTLDNIHFFEKGCKSLCSMAKELKIMNESLQKDNLTKDREIKQLNKSIQQYEQTICEMKKEVTVSSDQSPNCSKVSKKDAEVMAGMCCVGAECSELQPSKDISDLLREEALKYQERIQKMEASLQGSSNNVRALRECNVSLMEEAQAMRFKCAALQDQFRTVDLRSQFKDDVIREMRKQLHNAKTKVKEVCAGDTSRQSKDMVCGDAAGPTYDSVTIACVRTQPRRKRDLPVRDGARDQRDYRDHRDHRDQRDQSDAHACHSLRARDTCYYRLPSCKSQVSSSTPNASVTDVELRGNRNDSPDVSAIQRSESPSLLMSEDSLETPGQVRRSPSMLQARSSSSGELSPGTSYFWKRGHGAKRPKFPSDKSREAVRAKSKQKTKTVKVKTSTHRKVKYFSEENSMQTKNISKPEVSESGDEECPCGDDSEKAHESKRDSGGVCSMADSAGCSCDYSNKLHSTLQILQNQEETVRVQAESLSVADSRIKALNERVVELRLEAERKTKEMLYLRNKLDSYNVQKSDVCISADIQMGDHKDIVTTLQNNLGVIEELYRECFYETAKQENLIDMLRNSYLDVRLMDRRKADQIGRLQTVIDTQKLSLERCQDIALEVDNLKTEISNFLNGSTSSPNNDSGMWERSSEVPDVQEDLQDMMDKLLQLRGLLDSGCICGLEEENKQLKEDKENLTTQLSELSKRLCCLECELAQVDTSQYEDTIQEKQRETQSLGEQIQLLKKESMDQTNVCESLSAQLDHLQESLDSKNSEVECMRRQCEEQETTIKQLREELLKAEQIRQESCKHRSEVSLVTSELSSCHAQLLESQEHVRDLRAQLQRATHQHQHIEDCYREKASSVAGLQARLEEAHARGAALCGDARRMVRDVRAWAERMAHMHRDNKQTLKENEILIRALQQRLRDSDTSGSSGGCGCGARGARGARGAGGASTSSSPPLPPKRAAKKKWKLCSCNSTPATWPTPNRTCHVLHATCSPPHAACTPPHAACTPPHAACTPPHASCSTPHTTHEQRPQRLPRDISPAVDLASRMEQILEAFEAGQRRWRPREQR